MPAARLGADDDAAVRRRMPDRVLDQVEEDALELLGVGPRRASESGNLGEHRDALDLCLHPHRLDRLPDQLRSGTCSIDQPMSPASSRESSNRSSIRALSASMWVSSARCRRGGSRRSTMSSPIASASSRRDVIGVRRSCETAAIEVSTRGVGLSRPSSSRSWAIITLAAAASWASSSRAKVSIRTSRWPRLTAVSPSRMAWTSRRMPPARGGPRRSRPTGDRHDRGHERGALVGDHHQHLPRRAPPAPAPPRSPPPARTAGEASRRAPGSGLRTAYITAGTGSRPPTPSGCARAERDRLRSSTAGGGCEP